MERMIDLNKINHDADTFSEALGITSEEYEECALEIHNNNPLRTEMEIKNLGFSEDEIEKSFNSTRKTSETIADLWIKRGRDQLSLKEFILTVALVRRVTRERGLKEILKEIVASVVDMELMEETREKIRKLIEDHGTKVFLGTPFCAQWKEEHENSDEDCPKQLGCLKFNVIVETLGAMAASQPRTLSNPLNESLWIDITIKGFTIILKVLEAQSVEEIKKLDEFLAQQ